MCPKYCFAGKGSVVVPSFSYLRVAKMTQAWQGKARHEEAGGRIVVILIESVALCYNLGRSGKARETILSALAE